MKRFLYLALTKISFKSLSRQLSITAREAKKLLESYLESTNVPADQVLVIVVESKTKYTLTTKSKSPSYAYIYAISPCKITNTDSVQSVDLSFGPLPKYIILNRRLQTIVNPSVNYSDIVNKQATSQIFKMQDTAKKSQSESAPENETIGSKKQVKSSPIVKSTVGKKTKANFDFTKKPAVIKEEISKDEAEIPKGKPIKVNWNASAKVEAKKEEKSIDPDLGKSKQQLEQEKSIRSMFDDDEDLEFKPTPQTDEPIIETAPVAAEMPQNDPCEPEITTKRVRKRRCVKKQQTVMEGKYLVTEDVEVWESYSEDERIIPQDKNIVKKAKTGKFVQKPISMKSFFVKK